MENLIVWSFWSKFCYGVEHGFEVFILNLSTLFGFLFEFEFAYDL